MTFLKPWRFLLLALLAVAAVAAFSACGDDDSGGATKTPAGTATSAADNRQQGGTITLHSVEFQSLDPHYSNFSQDIGLQRKMWRGLYTLDKDNNAKPSMAASDPTISADGKTYTIKLRSGLKWSDGQPLTAKNFEAGLKRTCNPVIAGQYEYVLDASIVGCADFYNALNGPDKKPGTADDLKPADAGLPAKEAAVGVKATDDATLTINLVQAQPTFKLILALWMTFPVPTHLARFASQTADKPADWGTDVSALVYNGPYKATEYVKQDHITFVPNPNWAAPEGVKPTLDKIVVKFIESCAVADNAFRTGELDEACADLTQLASLKAEFGSRFSTTAQPTTIGLEMDVGKPPLDKLEVRLAISQSIDRNQLVQVVYSGAYQPTTTWLPATVHGAAPDFYNADIGYDPVKAKANLTKAGYANGAGFPTLKFTMRDTPTNQNLFAFLQKAFKDTLNINIEADVVDAPTRSRKFNTHNFQLLPGGWIQDYPDPENWIVGLFDTGGGNNGYECSDPDIDANVKKAQYDTNETERIKLYQDINKLIVTRVCGIAPYYHATLNTLISDKIVGMKENTAGQDSMMPGDWRSEAWGLKK